MAVILRGITKEDTNNIVRWRNNPNVLRMFLNQVPLTEAMHNNWMNTKVASGEVVQFIIVSDKKDVGSVFIRDIDHYNKTGEFGIFIGEDDQRGKGVGSAAITQILAYAFSNLMLNTVSLRVLEENVRAINSYLKAGFKKKNYSEDIEINGEIKRVIFMEVSNETAI